MYTYIHIYMYVYILLRAERLGSTARGAKVEIELPNLSALKKLSMPLSSECGTSKTLMARFWGIPREARRWRANTALRLITPQATPYTVHRTPHTLHTLHTLHHPYPHPPRTTGGAKFEIERSSESNACIRVQGSYMCHIRSTAASEPLTSREPSPSNACRVEV